VDRSADGIRRMGGAPREASRAPLRFHPDAAELLLLYDWPDNLRGVDRFVHRVLTSGEAVIGRRVLATLMPEIVKDASPRDDRRDSTEPEPRATAEPSRPRDTEPQADRPSREEFLAVYEGTGRNVRATSKHFGKDRRQIYRWLELFGIER